jgi:hypothetical protein
MAKMYVIEYAQVARNKMVKKDFHRGRGWGISEQ